MKVRKHYTLEQVAKIAKIPEIEADRILMKACHAGVLEYWMEEGEKTYAIPPFVVGSGEWSSIHRNRLEREPERAYFFDRDTVLPLLPMAKMVPPGGGGIGMHVIPVEKEVRRNEAAVPYEMISHWLDKYDGKFAAMPCVCRQSTEYLGEGCGDNVEDWCCSTAPNGL